jgi:hypothetical protein
MAAKSALMRPAQAFPAQDPFQSLLQGRMVAHLKRERTCPPVPERQKTEEFPLSVRQKRTDRLGGSGNSRRPREAGNRWPNPAERRLPPQRLPEAAALLLAAGFPPERLQRLLSDPQVQEQGLSLKDLRRAWQEATGTETLNSLFPGMGDKNQVSGILNDEPLPPALATLLDLVEQSPGGIFGPFK